MCEFISKAQPKMYKAINLSFLMNSSGSSMFVEAFQMILAIEKAYGWQANIWHYCKNDQTLYSSLMSLSKFYRSLSDNDYQDKYIQSGLNSKITVS